MSETSTPQVVKERPDLSSLRMERREPSPTKQPRRLGRWGLGLVGLAVVVVVAMRWPIPWLRPVVETTTVRAVTQTQASTVLTATGYTYARTRAAVGSKIIGRVVELRVDEGDGVRSGDVIAVLDSDDLRAGVRQSQAALTEAEARLVDGERELARRRRLVDAEVSPQAELDAAETQRDVYSAQVETARAQLDSLKAQLAYTVIHAPIDGVVIERNVEVGEMVAPGGFTSQQSTGAIVRIADPESLEVEADINESFISRIRLGQPAAIRIDAVPGHDYQGALRQIVPTADRQRAVVEVKVSITDRDERLVPDMSCTVTFLEEGTEAQDLNAAPRLLVASSAVVSKDDGTWLWRLRDGRIQPLQVQLGDPEGELVEVTSGAEAGDVVVLDPAPDLRAGERVRTGS